MNFTLADHGVTGDKLSRARDGRFWVHSYTGSTDLNNVDTNVSFHQWGASS